MDSRPHSVFVRSRTEATPPSSGAHASPERNASVPKRTLSEHVYFAIRARIIDRTFPPGTRLVERTIAEKLGVSRVPVREALRDLAREGFVEVTDRRGVMVPQISRESLVEAIQLRGLLETRLFSELQQNMTSDVQREFRALLDSSRSAIDRSDTAAAVELNARFHLVALAHSNSPLLKQMLELVTLRMNWLLTQHQDPALILEQHERIFDSLVSGSSAQLSTILEEHLQSSISQALWTFTPDHRRRPVP